MLLEFFKNKIKKSPSAVKLYEKFFHPPIVNYFATTESRNALLSYSTYHFKKKGYLAHSNYQESVVIAEILKELGYNVDIENNNRESSLDLGKYDLIIGEGLPIYQAAISNKRGKLVYYATGSHPWQCTEASLLRVCEYFKRHGQTLLGSTRTQDARWGIAANLSDLVICIGNNETRRTFYRYGCVDVQLVRPTFHPSNLQISWSKKLSNKKSRKSALWFGSYGLLHKGLDIAIEAFSKRPDWTLHICGHTEREPELTRKRELPPSIIDHGFVDIESSIFTEILESSCFVVLPSCSEGIATSVITAMGRGGLIPVVTRECGVDIDDFGVEISELKADSLNDALEECDNFSDEEIIRRSSLAYSVANENYTLMNYKKTMQRLLHEC